MRTLIPPQCNMSLWNPRFSHAANPGFSSLFRLLDDFDRYGAQQLGSTLGSTSVTTFSPKFDVAEHDKEYVLQGELPGVAPQNVEIEFTDDQTLVVRGHSERKHTEGDIGLLEGPESSRIEDVEGSKRVARPAAATGAGEEGAEETATQRPKYWLSERSYGDFSRVFTFPAAVDQDRVQAKFKDGILEVTVPRAEKRGGKRIAIQ